MYVLNSPIRIFTTSLLISCFLYGCWTVYFTLRFVGNKRFTKMMLGLIMLIIIRQIMIFMQLFIEAPPIFDWIITTFGMITILASAILQCEILYFFSSLTQFWNQTRIRMLEIFWVVAHFILSRRRICSACIYREKNP
jgi:hypothetical protein